VLNPKNVCLFYPRNSPVWKKRWYSHLGKTVGRVTHNVMEFEQLADRYIPAAWAFSETAQFLNDRRAAGKPFIYFDRGYFKRGRTSYAGLPKGEGMGFFRVHFGEFQMMELRNTDPARFAALGVRVRDWRKGGRDIVFAMQSPHYRRFHNSLSWERRALLRLRRTSARQIRPRHKGDRPPFEQDIARAHCVVSHGSIAAVEAAVLGIPVFVSEESAARHVGATDVREIENPVYPNRDNWLAALANCQFSWDEILRGECWRY
jgi:hypothetical protein